MPKINPLPHPLDGVMTYAELTELHDTNQLDQEGLKFYYAVNRRSRQTSPEDAFIHQKRIAIEERLNREAARHRPAERSPIPALPLSSAPAIPPAVREHCRTIMEVLRFDPPQQVNLADPRLLLTLPPRVQRMLLSEELTVGHAQALLVLHDPDFQTSVAEQARDRNLSAHDVQKLIATTFHASACVSCPAQLSRQVCHGILELWCRGQLLTHHVRFLLRELMSTRLMEEIGGGKRAPQRRIDAQENSCFISRKFAQGSFTPSFFEIDQYQINAPLSSPDSIFDLIWLHRKLGLASVTTVVQLALNHHGQREASWLLAVINLQTPAMFMLDPAQTFQLYLEDLRQQLTDRLHQLDEQYNQPTRPTNEECPSKEAEEDEDEDEDDVVGIELRQVVADLESLEQHYTAVQFRKAAQRREEEERARQEQECRREEEDRRIKETFRFKHLVEKEIAKIRAEVMRDYRENIRQTMKKQKEERAAARSNEVQDGLAEWDHAQSLKSPTEAKAWMKRDRLQQRQRRRMKLQGGVDGGARQQHPKRTRALVFPG